MSSTWTGASGPVPKSLLRVRTGRPAPSAGTGGRARSPRPASRSGSAMRSSAAASARSATIAPWRVPAGLRRSAVTSTWTHALRCVDHFDAGLLAQRSGKRAGIAEERWGSAPAAHSAWVDRSPCGGRWRIRWHRWRSASPVGCSSTRACGRSPAPAQDRARGVDAFGWGHGAHPDRHVRGERPHVGVLIQGDPGRHVDDERQDAGPHDAVVQRLRLRPEFDDEFIVLEPCRYPESARQGHPRARYVCHLVSSVDMRSR